jgi:xylulokinase
VVYDLEGHVLSMGRAGQPLRMPHPGWHEQPAEVWWRAMVRALRQALVGVDTARLAGLAIAHQRETFVPVDRAGRPLRAGILWMDERAASGLADLEKKVGRGAFHALTGKPLSANLTLAKIAWLQTHEPEVCRQTAFYLDVQAYLVQRLTGAAHTSWGSADPTGMFDMAGRGWAAGLLEAVGSTPDQMPPASPPGALLGHLTHQAARECGLPAGLAVFAGLGDGQAGGVGVNICRPGAAYLALGTSVITGSYSGQYVTHSAFRTMFGGVPGSYLLETVLLGGLYTQNWLMTTFFGKRGAAALRLRIQLEAELDQIPAGSAGLMLVPYWNSVMNPYWDATASGIVVGWRGIHRPVHLYRAILEGIAYELRLHLEGVEQALGIPLEQVVAVGGGARSEHWCQIVADVTGKPVYHAAVPEAAALGAAVLAAAGAGLYPSVSAAAQAMAAWLPGALAPRPEQHQFYSDLYHQVYRGLYPALRESLNHLETLNNPLP